MIGIYKITCLCDNKVYIGQSVCLARRIATHKRELKNNIHYNQKLQQAYNNYGAENFTYEIIDICKKEELNDKEKYYIEKFNSYTNGFNQSIGGSNISGENNPMYGVKGKNAPRFKDYIIQLDFNGNIVNKYESTIAAAEAVKGSTAHILSCLKTWQGKTYNGVSRFSNAGFRWIYENDYNILKQYNDFSKPINKHNIVTLLQVNKGALCSNT